MSIGAKIRTEIKSENSRITKLGVQFSRVVRKTTAVGAVTAVLLVRGSHLVVAGTLKIIKQKQHVIEIQKNKPCGELSPQHNYLDAEGQARDRKLDRLGVLKSK